MIVADYWAEARVRIRRNGRQITVRRHGWSDVSPEAAQALAEQRAAQALADIQAGQTDLPRGERKVPYHGTDGQPIREEIVARHGEHVITRNSYGAQCLNTPDVMFVDVDMKPKTPAQLSLALRRWVEALSLGYAAMIGAMATTPYAWAGVPVWLWLLVGCLVVFLPAWKNFWQRVDERFFPPQEPVLSPEQQVQQRLDRFAQQHPDWSLRVYRTRAGWRVLVTHQLFNPLSPEVQACFAALDADPVYALMCRNQRCFRARLTAKPWRIGVDRLRPCPGVWPILPDRLAARRAWVADYEQRASAYAACRYERSLGAEVIHPQVQPVLELHDRMTRAMEPERSLA